MRLICTQVGDRRALPAEAMAKRYRSSASFGALRRSRRSWAGLGLGFVLPAAGALLIGCSDPDRLELGTRLEKSLDSGQLEVLPVELEQGQFLRLEIDQWKLPLQAALTDPDGQVVARVESEGILPPQSLAVIAESTGRYHLELQAQSAEASGGVLYVNVRELRPSEGRDQAWLLAEAAYRAGEDLRRDEIEDSLRGAIEHYQKALEFLADAVDDGGTAKTENAMGLAYRSLEDYASALPHHERALGLWRRVEDPVGEAEALDNIAHALRSLKPGDLQPAIDRYRQAVDVLRSAAETATPATQSRRLLDSELGVVLNNLALSLSRAEDHELALVTHQESLQLRRTVGDREAIGRSLINLGVVYGRLGQHRQALAHYYEALSLLERSDECRALAALLSNLGTTYERLGQYGRARRYFCRALPLSIALKRSSDMARMLSGLGRALHFSGEEREALATYRRALSTLGPSGSVRIRLPILTNAGRSHFRLGEYRQALETFQEALTLSREVASRRSEAIVLSEIANVHRDQDDVDRALGLYRRALALSRDVGHRLTEALTLLRMAYAEQLRDRTETALGHLEEGLAIIEGQRSEVPDPHQRAAFVAFKNRFFELHVDLLMELHHERPGEGWDYAAFQASEGARARSLVDVLEGQIEVGRGVDPALLDRTKALELRLARLERKRRRLLRGEPEPSEVARAQEEIESVLARWQELRSSIFASRPSYRHLTEPKALGIEEIRSLLDSDTALLEYALGHHRSFWWLVTAGSFYSGELPPREEIEALARRIYELVGGRSEWDQSEYLAVAGKLSEIILQPIADRLGDERLVIVANGAGVLDTMDGAG